MPDETYRIIYEAVDKAGRVIDGLMARMAALDKAVDRTNGKLKALGADTSGIARFRSEQARLGLALGVLAGDAASAEKALKGVGKGNSSAAALTKRLAALQAQVASLQAAAATATPVVAGVGSGSAVGAKGGGGAAAGGGRRGMVLGVAAGAAMMGLRKAGSAMGDSLAARREYLEQAADMASEYRKELTPLAVLKGKNAPDDALMRQDIAFQKQSVMTPEDSRTFRLEFGGAISPALKARDSAGNPNITPKAADELEVEAARFTARYGLDATTGGRMAGLLGVTQKVPSASAGLGIMAETMEMLNVEGVGSVKALAGQMLSLSGGMLEEGGKGRFKSFPEMAARYAASTVAQAGNAARAKTRIVQSDRLLRKLAVDRESELGKNANILPADGYEEAIRKIAPLIAGPGGDQKLIQSGYKNSTERIAIIEEAKMNAIVDASLADPAKKARAARAVAESDAYAGSTGARQQRAENMEFASAIETGLMGERIRAARAAARARMADPNQPGGQRLKAGLFGSLTDMAASTMTTFGAIPGEQLRIDTEAMRGLVEGGRKVGVDVRRLAPSAAHRMDSGQVLDDDASRKEFNRAYQAVEAAGGDPFGGAPKDVARKMRAAADALDRLTIPGAGGQGPPPPGNGGAGVTPGRR